MNQELQVHLDLTRCKSYGICVSVLPDVFDVPSGSPVAVLLRTRVGADDLEDLEEAVRNCPAQAISFTPAPQP